MEMPSEVRKEAVHGDRVIELALHALDMRAGTTSAIVRPKSLVPS